MNTLSKPLTNRLWLVVGANAGAMLELIARLSLKKPGDACSVRVMDGGNQFNAYTVARSIGRQMAQAERGPGYDSLSLGEALRRIHLSRAFTCYQMVTLLEETPLDATPTCLLDLLSNFYDEAIRLEESQRLLGLCLAAIRRLSHQAPVVISLRPAGPRHADRACLVELLRAAADEVWEQEGVLAPPSPQPWW